MRQTAEESIFFKHINSNVPKELKYAIIQAMDEYSSIVNEELRKQVERLQNEIRILKTPPESKQAKQAASDFIVKFFHLANTEAKYVDINYSEWINCLNEYASIRVAGMKSLLTSLETKLQTSEDNVYKLEQAYEHLLSLNRNKTAFGEHWEREAEKLKQENERLKERLSMWEKPGCNHVLVPDPNGMICEKCGEISSS